MWRAGVLSSFRKLASTYGPAGELLTIVDAQSAPYSTERRQYNVLGQLTRITIPANDINPMLTPLSDVEYRYSAAQNDGQITSRKDYVSGEEVVYQYDNLSRLTSAVTTGPEWGLQFSYDGWGNRTEQRVVKGSGPANTFSYNPANNRLTGGPYTYDGNGNMTSHPTMSGVTLSYDVENRMATVVTCNPILGPWCTHGYTYAPDNKRVIGDGTYYFWAGNQLIGTYKLKTDQNNIIVGFDTVATYAYFGGRRLGERPDRLGSNGMGGQKYFPYGEEYTASAGDGYKFATYWRESAWNLDYADQRWYSSTLGRFLTPDPYQATSSGANEPTNPGTWNRVAYVLDNPVNLFDPEGTNAKAPGNLVCFYVNDVIDSCEIEGSGVGGGASGASGEPGGGAGGYDPTSGVRGPAPEPTGGSKGGDTTAVGSAPNNATPSYKNTCIRSALGEGALSMGVDAIGLIPEGGGAKTVARTFGNWFAYRGIVADNFGKAAIQQVKGGGGTVSVTRGLAWQDWIGTGLSAAGFIPVLGQAAAGASIIYDGYKTWKNIQACP